MPREISHARRATLPPTLLPSALALATGLSLPALGILGYQPGQPMAAGVGQSLAAVLPCPCLIKTLSAIWLFRAMPVLENRC